MLKTILERKYKAKLIKLEEVKVALKDGMKRRRRLLREEIDLLLVIGKMSTLSKGMIIKIKLKAGILEQNW